MTTSFTNNKVGEPFIVLQQVASTNNYAMEQAKNGQAVHGTSYFAEEQIQGKGQRNKSWMAEKGKNILLSVILQANWMRISDIFKVSVLTAVAAHDFFSGYVDEKVYIKWPNDIYWGDRKAGGILIENIIRGNIWQFAIAGIGININQDKFDPDLPNPVSLKQITGKEYNAIGLAKELCTCIEHRYQELQDENFDHLLQAYNAVLYKKNELVKFKKDNAVFSCMVKEVTAFGQLITDGAAQQLFSFGEVEWIHGQPYL